MDYPNINSWYDKGQPPKGQSFGAWYARFKNKGRSPKRRSRHIKAQMFSIGKGTFKGKGARFGL